MRKTWKNAKRKIKSSLIVQHRENVYYFDGKAFYLTCEYLPDDLIFL